MSWWKNLLNRARGAGAGGCRHEGITLREGTAEFEHFVARGELELGGDLKHGARHLANLLSYDPGKPEWVDLLESYLSAAGPDPETLIPRESKPSYTNEAMRAYIWRREGRFAEAVELLAQVTQARQDARYLEAWVMEWLEAPGAVESLPENTGLFLFSLVLMRAGEARLSTLRRVRETQRWAALFERFVARYPGQAPTVMLRAGLLRKAGLFEEAEAVVRPALERSPDWHIATALGLILRQKGDTAGAEKAFERALTLDPNDVSARLEAADMFWERDQWEPALKWYENALAKEPKQQWAHPSALFCRWMLTEDQQHVHELADLAKHGNERAQYLYHRLYHNDLPEPADATANILRQLRESILKNPVEGPESGGSVSLRLSSIEAPSNFLAFRLEMEALGRQVKLVPEIESIPRPDPREPIAVGKYVLWKYDGTAPSPGLPPPSPDVVERIRQLASRPLDPQENWAGANRAAEELGAARVGEILAVMVHPPPVPEGTTALAWLPRVQLAAMQVAGQVPGGEGERREALMSVLLGPQDWATEAAIRVLAYQGRASEVLAPEIHEAFEKLAEHRPDRGYCCWEVTLYQSWLELPHLFPKEREQFEKKLRDLARG